MKPYNEQEFNKLCAEFLEWDQSEDRRYWKETPTESSNWYLDELKFHSDWNWIMDVVDKIEKTCGVSIVGGPVKKSACVIHLGNLEARSGQGNSKKEAVVEAIWEFLN